MSWPIPYAVKRQLRIWDSQWSRARERVQFRAEAFEFYRTYWWGDTSQRLIDAEIAPYFAALEKDFEPEVIVDIGAGIGAFAIIAARLFPRSTVYCFEPAERQRVLFQRNAELNGVGNLQLEPFGLWNAADWLCFRTNGAESSFESVSRFQGLLSFPERVRVLPLDLWIAERKIPRIDLIKMDAEGAEIEILEGAVGTLRRFRPRLLVQAYHLRDGGRTFERCAELLQHESYHVEERAPVAGLLCAS